MSKPSCFIIMPLTTPARYVETYKGDTQHFIHVLGHLFKPAIEAAGLTPITPMSKGSKVIHGDIIRNLETADLVLCDMSILNPNVFFELGIRTALNKSVAMIRDNATERVPFDTNIINYHEYNSGLEPWDLDQEVEKLTRHLKECIENDDSNSLWSSFSMSKQAEVPNDAPELEKQVGYLIKLVEVIRDREPATVITAGMGGLSQQGRLKKIDKVIRNVGESTPPQLFQKFKVDDSERSLDEFVRDLYILKGLGVIDWEGYGLNDETQIISLKD